MSTHAEAKARYEKNYAEIEALRNTPHLKVSDKKRKDFFQSLMDSAIAGHREGQDIGYEYEQFRKLISSRTGLTTEGNNKIAHELKRIFPLIPPLIQKRFFAALHESGHLSEIIEETIAGKSLLPLSAQKSMIRFLAEAVAADPSALFRNDDLTTNDIRHHLEATKKEHARRQTALGKIKQTARLSGVTPNLEALHDHHQSYLDRGKLEALTYAIKGVLVGHKEGFDTQLECKIIAPLLVTSPDDFSLEAYGTDVNNVFEHLSDEQMEILFGALVKHKLFFMALYNFELEPDAEGKINLHPINAKTLESDKNTTINLPKEDIYSFLTTHRNFLLPERAWKIADKISFGIESKDNENEKSLWSQEDLDKLARLLEYKYGLETGTLILKEQDYIVYGEDAEGERLEILIIPDPKTGRYTDVSIPTLDQKRENILNGFSLLAGMELHRKGYKPADYNAEIREGTSDPVLTNSNGEEIDPLNLPDIKPAFTFPVHVWNETYDYGYSKPLTPDFVKIPASGSGIKLVGEFDFNATYLPFLLVHEDEIGTISDITTSAIGDLLPIGSNPDTGTGSRKSGDISVREEEYEEPQPRLLWVLQALIEKGFKPKKDLHIYYNQTLGTRAKDISNIVIQAMDEHHCFQIALCISLTPDIEDLIKEHRWAEILSPVGHSTYVLREPIDWENSELKTSDLRNRPDVWRAPCYTQEQYLNSIRRFAYTPLEHEASPEDREKGNFLRPQLKARMHWNGPDIAGDVLETIRVFHEETGQMYRSNDEAPITHGPLADNTTPKRLFDAFYRGSIEGLAHLKTRDALRDAALKDAFGSAANEAAPVLAGRSKAPDRSGPA